MRKKNLTLAVALDEAFCFYYQDNLNLFEKKGVCIKFFSPVKDAHLPENTDGILLGGGYPEYHLKELSENISMLESIKNAVDKGIPSLAECGGFMYLHKTITDMNGECHEMAGVCDGDCFYTGHLVRFGYMELLELNDDRDKQRVTEDSRINDVDSLLKSMTKLKGHEFHYFDSTCNGNTFTAAKPDRSKKWDCIVSTGSGIWGFPHFYYNSRPEFVDEFVLRMKEVSFG